MLKYGQIDLPLSRACGARTDDTERLEQTTGRSSNNENDLAALTRRAAKDELAACKILANKQEQRRELPISQ